MGTNISTMHYMFLIYTILIMYFIYIYTGILQQLFKLYNYKKAVCNFHVNVRVLQIAQRYSIVGTHDANSRIALLTNSRIVGTHDVLVFQRERYFHSLYSTPYTVDD